MDERFFSDGRPGRYLPFIAMLTFGLICGLAFLLCGGASPATATGPEFAPPPAREQSPATYSFPGDSTIILLGDGQDSAGKLRDAYKSLFAAVYGWDEVIWTAAWDSTSTYPPGTIIAPLGGGDFYTTTGGIDVSRSLALQPVKIALFYSALRDEYDQVVTWEEGDFEQLFRVYLWGDYFTNVDEDDIANGRLDDYDVLILPTIRLGYADDVVARLGANGLNKVKAFVEGGGTVYAQGEALHIVQETGLVPTGTVNLSQRVTDLDNQGQLTINEPDSPLTFSWLANETYVLNEPLMTAMSSTVPIATYDDDTSQPGSPAILYAMPGEGKVILMSGHPSDKQEYHPQVLDALLLAMGQRAGLHGTAQQEYSTAVEPDLIPAYEGGVAVRVTTVFKNLWDVNMQNVVVTEIVQPGFTVEASEVSPAPTSLTPNGDGTTTIVWDLGEVAPGATNLTYLARTEPDALAKGSARVSTASATYYDPVDTANKFLKRNDLYIQAKMAARLQGDRDIELDGVYPLPGEGNYFDIALTLENKEETRADGVVITDVVALVSPVVDVVDQTKLARVVTYTADVSEVAISDTVWVENQIFFYNNANYTLPTGFSSNSETFDLSDWDPGDDVYVYEGPFTTTAGYTNSVSIPTTYADKITLNAAGDLVLPAKKLVWDFGALQGYDYLEPAVRYGIFSQELSDRRVAFMSDPYTRTTDTNTLNLSGGGGSVYTNLGGDPIPFHEYLESGVVYVPKYPEKPRVTYQDIWLRDKSLDLRTVFYDIVPFPPPEYHAVVNTTFEMKADLDGDGTRDDQVLEYPSRQEADLNLYLRSFSNFAPGLDLRQEETLISQGIFKGLGFKLEPKNGSWDNSWSSPDGATTLTTVVDMPAYSYLYFQQELPAQERRSIHINANLSTYGHREGVMKVNDGARFVYHQKAVGPNRYEVFDAHVQAVFGISSDAEVSKKVAPVRVATYEDTTYHFIEVKDPWDPHEFGREPVIKSYGFWDKAATTYVGGRDQRNLLYPRLAPGGQTQIRVEINNNAGSNWTGVSVTPVSPSSYITVTKHIYADPIAPIFFDFPYLEATIITDAWKGVYYFDVGVSPGIPDSERGQVHEITFNLSGTPADLQVPAAMIGVEDAAGHVKTTWGQATNLVMTDILPEKVTPQDVRLANGAEKAALENVIATAPANAEAAFDAIPRSATFSTVTTTVTGTQGTEVTFNLPDYAQLMPWLDEGMENNTLYVILKSRLEFDYSGTNLADYAPVINYTDPFNVSWSESGNEETVEAHGAVLAVQYSVNGITRTADSTALDGLQKGVSNTVEVDVMVTNLGDYIAGSVVVTVDLASGVTATAASSVRPTNGGPSEPVVSNVGDIAPGETKEINLILSTTPGNGLSAAAYASYVLIERTDGRFINRYPPERPRLVSGQLAGPLELREAGRSARIYLPGIFHVPGWWPQEE